MEIDQQVSGSPRIQSVDILRGLVMIIMAIDHVRVYSGIPAGGVTAGIFFTRWITHYCAPAFAFYAGTSAFLFLQKTKDHKALVRFLLTRGILLVILELTVIRFFWTFNFDYARFTITGVIWMLGWSMILLAAFVRMKPVTVAIAGMLMIAVQQVFQYVPLLFPESVRSSIAQWWGFFYPSAFGEGQGLVIGAGSSGLPKVMGLSIFYVIIPWIGVMMAGFGFGKLLMQDHKRVRKLCLWIGLSATLLFIVGASIATRNIDGDIPFIFKMLNQKKYPPSQLYILMTIGPVIALTPWAEKIKGKLADAVKTIGRVPMFYYLLHLLIIHLSAFVVNLFLFGKTMQTEWYITAPFVGVAEDQRWTLPLLYLVWAIDVVILFFACRWYARYKASHPHVAWTKYI